MHKLHSKLNIFIRTFSRTPNGKPAEKFVSKHVDLENKVVYGGDLPMPTSNKSVGSILFNRLTQKDRENNIFQVCVPTRSEMTTKTFIQNSVALAERLLEKDIKKGDFIILIGKNSFNLNVALAGILFIGAVPLPVSCTTYTDEFKLLVNYVKPKFFGCDGKYLFSLRRVLMELSDYDLSKIFLLDHRRDPVESDLEPFGEFIKGRGKDVESFKPADVNSPEEVALALKSLMDGKIGKAVGLTHHNINSVIARYDSRDPERQRLKNDVCLMVQELAWISGITSFLISCCFGPKLVMMNEFDEENFMQAIEDYKVTRSYLYTSKLWQLYKFKYKRKYDISSCKFIYSVDGALSADFIIKMKDKIGLVLKPSYGRNELCGTVLEPPDDDEITLSSVGQLVPQIYGKVISDYKHQKVGPNQRGEICFKGSTIAKEYINDELTTRQMFDKEGYLLSGHYGYYDEKGNFYFIDKIHHVIKYKDHKISPRELEGIIKLLDAVKDVNVSGIQHAKDGYYPIAFVVLQKGRTLTAQEIVKYVNGKVSDSFKKLRGGVVFVSKIPRSRENGRIKRNAIKKMLSKFRINAEFSLESSEPEISEKDKDKS